MVKYLLSLPGINALQADDTLKTALHHVARRFPDDDNCDAAIVKDLVAAKASVAAVDHKGQCALKLAATMDNLDVATALIELGGNVNSQDYGGESPLDAALARDFDPMIELLLDHGAEGCWSTDEESSSDESSSDEEEASAPQAAEK